MSDQEKTNYWADRIDQEYTPLERLLHEVRIYSELAEKDIEDGEDLTGARFYQKIRMEEAIIKIRGQA